MIQQTGSTRPARLLRRLANEAGRHVLPRRTVRLRLTVLYGVMFLLSGAVLLAITSGVVYSRSSVQAAPAQASQPLSALARAQNHIQQLQGELAAMQQAQHSGISHNLLIGSVIGLGIMTVVSVALGWGVAGRALRPLRQMTAATRRISEDNLHERLAVSGPDDEMKDLADTIDGLLERLEGAFAAQRRFVANASHELRTPLTIMRTELEVTLDHQAADTESLRAMGQVIRGAVARSERLVDGLLALAESERGIDRTERVDLAELVNPALGHLADSARQAGIRTGATLQAAPVIGSRVLLERLVENLADNGIRHNRPGGWLAILTASHGGTVTLIAESSGPPITTEQAASLFEPFRRLHADHVGSARGSGLGLSIVHAVARAHGGDATASPVVGGGLRVTVTLLAAPPATIGARPDHAAVKPPLA